MLAARIENNELITEGEVTTDDIYPGFCCAGHSWEVVVIFPDSDERSTTIYGVCRNPECPNTTGEPDDYYRGVNSMELEDFATTLAERTTTMNTATVPTGILEPFRAGGGMISINLAVRKFRYDRPEAKATEIHIHPHTVKAKGIDPATVKRLTGLELVTNDPEVRENLIRVIGLEGV